MIKIVIFLFLLALAGCTHAPKCGNPEGAKIIFTGDKTCQVRIRQVTIGSDLKIPQSLKGIALVDFTLEWIEPTLESGRIELGHFILIPSSIKKEVEL